MKYKNLIYLCILLLIVFILGINLLQFQSEQPPPEGLTTIQQNIQNSDRQNYNNSPTTYYGSTGEHVPPLTLFKNFNKPNTQIYLLHPKIVDPLCPLDPKFDEIHEKPTLKCQNNTNDHIPQREINYKPYLTSYATSQVEGNKFNKFKSVNSINSEFIPIPVLNSFHSFGK
jgi:hypothetical protein